ncbi:MAG TPA: KH domain-containing protein [Actinomycetota bacterium]|nr:KH domain-containing protein [Actinomycetota bacterium]
MTRELLEYVVPWLVDSPDAIEITEVEGDRGATVLELSVDPDDVGKVIGKRGRIIRSLRALAKASQHDGGNIMVEVVD